MKTLKTLLMILTMVWQTMAQTQIPNAPTNLSATGLLPTTGIHDEYCTQQGTWIGATMDGPARLPWNCMPTDRKNTPSPGVTHGPYTTAAQLQAAINAGACGDKYLVQAGSDFGLAVINLPHKNCPDTQWNLIDSTGASDSRFPREGKRLTPCWGGVQSMPNRSYQCPAPVNLMFKIAAANASNAMVAQTGGDHWRIHAAWITRDQTAGKSISSLVDLGSSNTTAQQANHIIFDQSWFDGVEFTGPAAGLTSDTSTTRALYLAQANHVAVVDSYFTNFYDTSVTSANGNTDAQCWAGGFGSVGNSGWGVYKFVNNHCEASGEGMLVGGAGGPPLTPVGCTITVNCNLDTPADLEVRQNYFLKPVQWNGNTTVPGSTGWPVVKNGFEMKTGARALFEGNVVENCWYNAQGCGTFNVAPVNQQSGGATPTATCPTCVVQDFTYRYNYSYNVAYGIAVYSFTPTTCPTCQSQGMSGVSIHDNVIGDNLNLGNLTGQSTGDAMEVLANDDPTGRGLNKMQNVNISNNTFVRAIRSMILFGGPMANAQMVNVVMQNNIWPYGNYGFVSAGSTGSCDTLAGGSFYTALGNCISSWTVDHNAEFNWNGGAMGRNWPTNGSGLGNWFFTSPTATASYLTAVGTTVSGTLGFVNYGTGNSGFNPANYQLTLQSPLHSAGVGGRDLGADIAKLLLMVNGVRE